jgi:hypothetical protein
MGLTLAKYVENFNPLRPERPPLSGQSGLQLLFRAEQLDSYRRLVAESALNRMARAGENYLPAVHSVNKAIPPADPAEPWPNGQVVWMDPTSDSGLPHTRAPNLICISQDFPVADLANTLLHERVHVSQRLNQKAWEKIMGEVWDMKPWFGEIPGEIQMRRRINPDLLGVPLYIWKNQWVPLALFKSSNQPKLTDTDIVWWNATQRVLHREPPPGWRDFFGRMTADEHPFEIAAYLIAASPQQNPAYKALRPRFKDIPTSEV